MAKSRKCRKPDRELLRAEEAGGVGTARGKVEQGQRVVEGPELGQEGGVMG